MRTRFTSLNRALSGTAAAMLVLGGVAVGVVGMTGCATPSTAASVPDELRVAGPVVGRVHATGFQVYTFQADGDKLAWKLKAPDATFSGDFKGKHYKGPTWECTADGSKVTAVKVAEHGEPDAVPWLLLKASAHEGKGVLSDVTFIQRLNTTGGRAPVSDGAKPGDETRIAYTADYVFFGPGAAVPGT